MLLVSTATAAEPTARADLASSVRFEQDRDAAQLLGQARSAADRGDLTQAVALLQQVLDGGADRLVLVDGVYRNAADEANRRLVELPAGGLAAYERHSGDAARAALAQAREPQALLDVAVRYRQTRAGGDALRRLAQQWMDSGRFADAALAYAAILEQADDPDAEARNDPSAIVGWCAALLSAGEQNAARGVQERFRAALQGRTPGPQATAAEKRLEALFSTLAEAAAEPEQPLPRDLADVLPTSSAAVWEAPTLPDSIDRPTVDGWLTRLDDSGVPAMSYGQPLSVAGGVVIRTLDAVICFDTASGAIRWRHDVPLDAGPYGAFRPPQALVECLMGDGATSALTDDGRRVYFVAPPPPPEFDDRRLAPVEAPIERGRRLVAVNVDDGHVAWEAGTGIGSRRRANNADESDFFADLVEFQGPPVSFESKLHLIAERNEALHLVVLDGSTGAILWTTKLAALDSALGRDDRRHAQHCRPTFVGGLAICPTGGGGVVAVDRLGRTVRWAWRYPREPIRVRAMDELPETNRLPQVLWPGGWRDLTIVASGEARLLLASPESDVLWALDPSTGRLAWQQPRDDGMYLAGADDDRALVAGRHSVRAYDASSGALLWNTAVEEPVGRGFATSTHYVFPIRSGGVAAVELATGTVRQTFPQRGTPPWLTFGAANTAGTAYQPRNLAWMGGTVIAQTPASVSRLNNLRDALAAANTAANETGRAAAALDELARLERETGDIESAIAAAQRRLELLAGPDAEAAMRDLLDTLWWAWERSDQRDELEPLIRPLLSGSRDRLRFAYARFTTAPTDPPSEIVARAFEILELFNEPVSARLEDGEQRVRLDRLVQARLLSARERLGAAGQVEFDQALDAALAKRLDGSSPLEVARWADLLCRLPQGQRLRLQLAPQWSSVLEFAHTQLRLEAQSATADPPLAAGALRHLAGVFEQHQDLDDATAAYRRLRDRFGSTILPDNTRVAALLEQIRGESPIGRRLLGAMPPVWPQRTPAVSVRPWPEGEIYFASVPVSVRREGVFDRLNVAVDRNGAMVRFSGSGLHRPWALPLPRSTSNSRLASAAPDLRRAWGFGQVLVLQVGADVFGIAPFDAAGEPSATLLWPTPGRPINATDTPIPRQSIAEAIAPRRRPADFDGSQPRTDPLGHRVGQVGPVCAEYFCVLRQGVLTAHDTATGAELWSRRNLPPGTTCCGDDRYVIVVNEAEGRRDVLQSLDGARLWSFAAGYTPEQALLTTGCRVLLEAGGAGPAGAPTAYSLTMRELASETISWNAEFPPGSACFPVDGARCGVLQPEGTIILLRLDDGQPVSRHKVEMPQQVVRVLAFVDPDSIHVIVSGPPDDPAFATPAGGVHLNEGYRRAIINGTWHAFDRDSGAWRWSRQIDNASLLLDQALDVPLLVFNEHIYPPDRIGQGTLEQRVRCFDKRTGELLYESRGSVPHNYFVVERDEEAGWVEVRLPGEIVRFDYSSTVP